MAFCHRTAALLLLTVLVTAGSVRSAPPDASVCGKAISPCCCQVDDGQNPRCCAPGLQCTLFRGTTSYQAITVTGNLCLPNTSPAPAAAAASSQSKPCGIDGGPCCLTQGVGGIINSSCSTGLQCMPSSSSPTGSQAQLQKLITGGSAAASDTSVVGVCRKFTAADCGQPFMPCGRDAAAAGVKCPNGPAACIAGHYCAADYDAFVGERCLPLPEDAGKVGGPCLPNNLPNAPIVDPKKTGQKIAPAFCPGTATCFMSVIGDKRGFTHTQPDVAKVTASRITGTVCLDVPDDCGSAPGKRCCPSDFGAITDKPLPSFGTGWEGSACSNETSIYGMYCSGSYIFLSGNPLGTCVSNPVCGGPKQPCCNYSKPGMAGKNCPFLGGPGAGFCNLRNICTICPKMPEILEDVLRCY